MKKDDNLKGKERRHILQQILRQKKIRNKEVNKRKENLKQNKIKRFGGIEVTKKKLKKECRGKEK